MAVEDFFTDRFIHSQKLYTYRRGLQESTGQVVDMIMEKDPEVIRASLKKSLTSYGVEAIKIIDANLNGKHDLLLAHDHNGSDLDVQYAEGTLRSIWYLWGGRVYLKTILKGKNSWCYTDGKEFKVNHAEK
jgi:stage V sporulation protein R